MRHIVLFAAVAASFTAMGACSASGESAATGGDGGEKPTDGGAGRDVAIATDAIADARGPLCSADGWCETPLPDSDLVVRDIWPLPGRAFALAESYALGIRVLEWNDAESKWRYVDDNSQNEALADNPTKIWARGEDEVYFTLGDATIYRGTRADHGTPGAAWTWTHEDLPNGLPSRPRDASSRQLTLGVWGIGGDVYAWNLNTIFHRRDDGAWNPEYVLDDVDSPTEYVLVVGAAGTREGDVWFSGVRVGTRRCAVAVRRTPEGYRRIADAVASGAQCEPRADLASFGADAVPEQFQSADGQSFYALGRPEQILRISPKGSGYAIDRAAVTGIGIHEPSWNSLWLESEDRVWLSGGANWGAVVRGEGIWDGGSYEYSSVVLNGAPLTRAPLQVRGTSVTNLWAVGAGYALHKTTP